MTIANGSTADADDILVGHTSTGTHNNEAMLKAIFLPAGSGDQCQYNVAGFSATKWTVPDYYTTDSGSTWSNSTGGGNASLIDRSRTTDSLKAIEITGTTVRISSDAGANWSSPTTSPSNFTGARALQFLDDTHAWIWGTNSGAEAGIWFSDDGGDTWTAQSDGGANNDYLCGSMFDTSTGYCVKAAATNDVYKTVNGGTAWSDTTHTGVGGNNDVSWLTLTATTAVYATKQGNDDFRIYDYDNGTGTSTLRFLWNIGNAKSCQPIKSSGGNVYLITQNYSANQVVRRHWLLKSTDSGVTWSLLPLHIQSTEKNITDSADGMACRQIDEIGTTGEFLVCDKDIVQKLVGLE